MILAIAIIGSTIPVYAYSERLEAINGITKRNIANTQCKLVVTIPSISTPDPLNIQDYYHKQLDNSEYIGEFAPAIKTYLNGDYAWNFCGVMTLLNALEYFYITQKGLDYPLSAIEMVNKYFVNDNGGMVYAYKDRGYAFRDPNGSMSPAAVYWLADKIGKDTGLWAMDILHGYNDFTPSVPITQDNLTDTVNLAQERVFSNGGVLIAHVGIASGEEFSYYHYLLILGMRVSNGIPQMLIVDSMGADHNGFYGWVNINDYVIDKDNPSVYTGLANLYSLIPQH